MVYMKTVTGLESWTLIGFTLMWFSHFPGWGEDHSHLADEGSTDVSYGLESTGPDWSVLGVKSEQRKIKKKLEITRTNAAGMQWAVRNVGERDWYPPSWFCLNLAKPHSQISKLRLLCKTDRISKLGMTGSSDCTDRELLSLTLAGIYHLHQLTSVAHC